MAPVEPKPTRGYLWTLGVLGVLIVPPCLLFIVWGAMHLFQAKDNGAPLMVLSLAGLVLLLRHYVLKQRRWIKRIDAEGVLLRDGTRFPWAEFQRTDLVVSRMWGSPVTYRFIFQHGVALVDRNNEQHVAEILTVMDALTAPGKNPFLT